MFKLIGKSAAMFVPFFTHIALLELDIWPSNLCKKWHEIGI